MIIYGKQVFLHYLNNHQDKIREIFLAKEVDKILFKQIAKSSKKITKLDFIKAQAMAKGGNHQGFLASVDEYRFCEFDEIKKLNFVLILYQLQDVGNIGAIVRTAYSLGVDGILVIAKNLNASDVVRTSQGALIDTKICVNNDVLSCINELKQLKFKIISSQKNGKTPKKLNAKTALILGNESTGIPAKIMQKCDEVVGIKMQNNFDSLNVNAACAILCDRILNG